MKKLILTITAIASLFLISCNSNSTGTNSKGEKENLTVTEANALLKANALLIDVRNPDELAEQSYDVKEVVNIPLADLESNLADIPKDKEVIVACKAGGRSQKALDLLKKNGFTNISNMQGGITAWTEAGFPTKAGETTKKACCANPNSKDCNPDGTCKQPADKKVSDNKTDNKPSATNTSTKNHLEVFAFHGTRQCTTCIDMKANTTTTINNYFSNEVKTGEIIFQIIDVDDEKNAKLAEKFQATGTALMINKVVNGKDNITDLSDFAFDNASNPTKFIPQLKSKIEIALK